jgi:hypothetical protein
LSSCERACSIHLETNDILLDFVSSSINYSAASWKWTRRISVANLVKPIGAGNLPVFMGAKNLKPFIDEELAATAAPIPYQPKTGRTGLGIDASVLPKICEVWLKRHP